MQFIILLASNDNSFVKKLQETLRHLTKDIITISDSEILLSLIFDKPSGFDFLILDNDLVGLEGHDVLPIIKKVRPKTPIIFVGQKFGFDVDMKIASSGVTARLIKPDVILESTSFVRDIKNVVSLYISKSYNLEKNNQ